MLGRPGHLYALRQTGMPMIFSVWGRSIWASLNTPFFQSDCDSRTEHSAVSSSEANSAGVRCTVICLVENRPTNTFLSENLLQACIHPSKVIEFHFSVKNCYFFIFIKLVHFLAISPYELQENLTFNDQYYLFWPILLKFMVVHIR